MYTNIFTVQYSKIWEKTFLINKIFYFIKYYRLQGKLIVDNALQL